MYWDILFFVLTILLFILVGVYRQNKVRSQDSYLFAEKKCGYLKLTSALVMTELNTSTLLSFAGLGFLIGKKALFLPLIFLMGLLFYSFTVAKKWKEANVNSVSDLFRRHYGDRIANLASISLLVAMLGFSGVYIKSLQYIFAPFLPHTSSWLITAALVVLTLFINVRGGLSSILRTDLVSLAFILLFFPCIFYFSIKGNNITALWSQSSFLPEALPFSFIFSLVVLTMFTYILAPWYGQKIFAAKSKQVAFGASISSSILVFALYGIITLSMAFFRVNTTLLNHEMALPVFIKTLVPIGLRGVGFALIFAVGSTTLSGVWSAMSSMISIDFRKKTESSYLSSLRYTILVAILSYLFANVAIDQIFSKMILANIPIAALSFALLGAFYWKKVSSIGASISIIIGLIWGIFCYLYFGDATYTIYWAFIGIPLIFGFGVLGSVLFPNLSRVKA